MSSSSFTTIPKSYSTWSPYFELDQDLWDLRGALRDNPLLLRYMTHLNLTNDECLMLELARGDGRSLQYMSKVWQSNKRIVLAALRAGPDVYKYVEGNALRRDPDVRKAAGLKPLYKWPRVPRNREEEVTCTDDSEDDDDDDDDDDDGEDHGGQSNPAAVWSMSRIRRENEAYDDASSDEEPESPTSTFDVSLRARNKDDSSSDEEDVSHGMDAGNVVMADAGEEGASPPLSPTRGDYPDYDRQRALDRSIATMREKRSWRNG